MAARTEALPAAASEVRAMRIGLAVLIGLACAWLGRSLPFAAGADAGPACRLLFVTGLTTACWLLHAMPIAAASLLPLALLPLLGVASTEVLTEGYGDPILWLFAGGFVLALAVERSQLHRRFALRVVAALGPRPRRLVTGFFLAATGVSMWINNTAVALLLLPIGKVLVQRVAAVGELGPRAQANFGAGVMCAIAFGASIGGIGSPIGTAPNALFFAAQEPLVAAGAVPVSFLAWVLAFAPCALVLALAAAFVLVRVALPLPGTRFQRGDELLREAHELPRWSRAERRTAWLFATAVLLWTTRGDLQLGGGDVLHGWAHYLVPTGERDRYIADGSVAVLVAILAFLIPSGADDRSHLVDWETARQMPFDLLLLLGGGIAMAAAFGPTGLSAAFGELLRPLVGAVHPAVLLLVLVVSITLLSEVASNTAVATLLLPILRDGAIAARIDPLALMVPAVIAASCGFMLPIATPPNTIVFASRQITFGQMARAGCCVDLLAAAVLVPMLWWWALPLLGVDPGALSGAGGR
ncbi:MAG: DASS family sodium-coupled anion symporter [Planctomycetes bacterium]|nr:DASS family sodium-coupled anion symporter [Planctomycetota bacterium]